MSISFGKLIANLGLFWQEKTNNLFFRWNLLFVLFQVAILFLRFRQLPPQLPLFYSLPWGESQLVTFTQLFYIPLNSFIVLLVNNYLSAIILSSHRLLSYLLIIFSFIFSFLGFFVLLRVILLVS